MNEREHGPRSPRPRQRGRGRGSTPATSPVLLAHLVRELWPGGPDGGLDRAALQRVSADYARRGDDLRRLLHDLEQVVDVAAGDHLVDEVSLLVEQSALAWSDAFLGTQAIGRTSAAVEEPERIAVDDLPSGPLTVIRIEVSGADAAADLRDVSLAAAVHLPGSQVVLRPRDRLALVVLARVADAALRTFATACAERTRHPVVVRHHSVAHRGDAELVHLLDRAAG